MRKSDLLETLEKKLSKCQVIPFSDDTYTILMNMHSEDWIKLNNDLQNKGYHIIYNNVDDCFVVH